MPMTEKLAYLKRVCHITTAELSHISGVPLGTLNKICSGATKNPASASLCRVAKALDVPVRYLTDDDIPLHFELGAFAAQNGLVSLSAEELDLVFRYRRLSECDRRTVALSLNLLSEEHGAATPMAPEHLARRLLCFAPVAEGLHGAYADRMEQRLLSAVSDTVASKADFAVLLTGHSLEPIHGPGTVLGVQAREARHNQIGVFLLNRECFVRRFYRHRDMCKLVPNSVDLKPVMVHPGDEFHCMGVVVGAIRHYHWL